jgi:hypothetical protein
MFSEFTRFLPKGLNPFKIHGRFKLQLVPKFLNWNPVGTWSWANGESCSSGSNLASCTAYTYLELGKAFDLNFKFRRFWNKRNFSNWAGPTSQRRYPFRPRARCLLSTAPPTFQRPCRTSSHRQHAATPQSLHDLSSRLDHLRRVLLAFLLLVHVLSIALLCRSCSTIWFTITGHHHHSASPSKPKIYTAVFTSSPSTCFRPESSANDAGNHHSPRRHLPPSGQPSTATARAPPALPPLRGEPHAAVVRPWPRIHHRRPVVHSTIVFCFTTDSLAIARLPRSASLHALPQNRILVKPSCSSCHSPPVRPLGIGGPDLTGEPPALRKGKNPLFLLPWAETPYGPGSSCRSSPLQQCHLFIIHLIYSIQIPNLV